MTVRFTCPKHGLTTERISEWTTAAPTAQVYWDGEAPTIESIYTANGERWTPDTDKQMNDVCDQIERSARRQRLNRWSDYFVEVDVDELLFRDIELPAFAEESDYVIGLWIRGDVEHYRNGPPMRWHSEPHVDSVKLWNFEDGSYIYEAMQDEIDEELIQRERSI